MNKWVLRAAIAILSVIAIVVAKRTILAPAPVSVQVTSVGRGRVESTITNSKAGTVKARRRAGLSTGTAGIVATLEVERGDRVEPDQILLRLDNEKQRSELLYAERRLALARAGNAKACVAAERAQRAWERNEALAQDRVVSADSVDDLKTRFELSQAECRVAAAEVDLAAAAVDVARAELDKTVLRAPFRAIVADVSVEVGEWVTPSVPLVTAPDLIDAIDPSSLYISAPMDEVDATLLRLGQRVRITIDSHPGQSFWGSVVRLAPHVLDIEEQNRTLEIEVELDDQDLSATLLPGTSADVEVILKVRDDVLRIPTHALMEGGVALVLADGRLSERDVQTGIKNWDWTVITGGLEVGNQVVTNLDHPDIEAGAAARLDPVQVEP